MQYYVIKNGEQTGPFSVMDVRQRLQAGTFDYRDLAWREGMNDWSPLKDIMGGALPDATPHAVSPWTAASAPAPRQTPVVLRTVTALVLFFMAFVFIFIVAYMLVCMIGGFCVGFQAGFQHPGTGAEAGREAGKNFVQDNLAMIAGGSALFSLVVSPVIAYFMAFSNVFPLVPGEVT